MKKIVLFAIFLCLCGIVSAQQLQRKPLPPRPALGNRPGPAPRTGAPGPIRASGNSDGELQEIAQKAGTVIGEGLGLLLSSGRGWDGGKHRIDLGVGYGIDYGGLGVKVNYQSPIVFGVTAGIGYNPGYASKPGNDRKLLWNAGIQLWCTDHWNFEIGVGPAYFKKFGDTQIGVSFMTHYQHQVWRRLGLIGGIGGSLSTSVPDGFKKGDTDARFEWNIGIVVRLLND